MRRSFAEVFLILDGRIRAPVILSGRPLPRDAFDESQTRRESQLQQMASPVSRPLAPYLNLNLRCGCQLLCDAEDISPGITMRSGKTRHRVTAQSDTHGNRN
ncbi:hypothetical protein SKAU_G00163860 [Synaphobranchus kaupii]|uniref:Uncharacterized protein n=1 Tax=Synaphobranchus kaupii TaxID=118154 RepID=A0A9Q1FJ66_SYNKA|nr:hypothetical protein SKAU_G00163860 [Synaphobranchus kaupii]